MEILNILKFIIEHGQLFFITLEIIVVTQLIYLYFHRILENFFLLFVHKILVFILIILFYIYNKLLYEDNIYLFNWNKYYFIIFHNLRFFIRKIK